jgi:integrase
MPTEGAIRGMGNVYQRGHVWWVRYWHRGEQVRESSKSPERRIAEKLLKKRMGELGRNPQVDPSAEARVRMADLFEALVTAYKNNGRRSLATLEYRLAALRAHFGSDRAADVTAVRIGAYIAVRRAEGKQPATVNRELAALRRAFRLGVEHERLTHVPRIQLLVEHNTREGFLSPATLEAVVAALPAHMQDATRFAYLSGWRKGEVTTLTWADVDRTAGLITLRRAHSKNGEPRELPVTGGLAELIERRWQARTVTGPAGMVTLSPLVFHRQGAPLGDFRKAWAKACTTAQVPGKLFHDLRRSAIVNMDRAGVSQTVAMALSGHRTASVWRRYRIVSTTDLRAAMAQVQDANASATAPAAGDVVRPVHAAEGR